ncbi:DUF4179 domain-containing protein [Saccharibacillus endophyticus]|uniref:DUF4179 domain-containing protein n=1 Tax=Saccharibacillus endophyticus TaxID=2060666 RepID=A0ABQ1ZNQ0_9BACL|nr:DUF4179 domain-containing protein [Saccharibacillus endophyticus]GGH70158.1 hypothetical protein GCM10007362_05980 [Saccharibacillus endophyticus]
MKAYFARFAARRFSSSEREIVERLKADGPDSLKKLNPGVTFDRIWHDQPDQMKRIIPVKRNYRMPIFAALAAILLLASAAIYGWNESRSVPAKWNISGIDFRHLVDEVAPRELRFKGEERIDEFFTPLNIRLEDQGITLTLVKAYYDGNDVKIDYVAERSDTSIPLNEATSTFEYELKRTDAESDDPPQAEIRVTRTVLDSHRFAGTLTYAFWKFDGPQKIKLALRVHELASTPGNWQTELELDSSKTDARTLTFFPNQTIEYQGYVLRINKIKVGPLWNVIETTRHNPQEDSSLEITYSDDIDTRFLTGNRSYSDMNPSREDYQDEVFAIEPFSAINPEPSSLALTLSKIHLSKPEDADAPEDDMILQTFDGHLPLVFKGFDGETMTLTDIDMQKDRTVFRTKYNSPHAQSWIFNIRTKKGEILSFNIFSPERISANELIFERAIERINPDDIAAFMVMPFRAPESQKRFEIPLDWNKAVKGRH